MIHIKINDWQSLYNLFKNDYSVICKLLRHCLKYCPLHNIAFTLSGSFPTPGRASSLPPPPVLPLSPSLPVASNIYSEWRRTPFLIFCCTSQSIVQVRSGGWRQDNNGSMEYRFREATRARTEASAGAESHKIIMLFGRKDEQNCTKRFLSFYISLMVFSMFTWMYLWRIKAINFLIGQTPHVWF